MSQPQPAGTLTPSGSSRRRQIPGTMVLNWQPPETQASKPLIRRPMTACEPCRSAKVKCNGQRNCERCRNRGLRCTYAPAPNAQNGNGISNRSVDSTESTTTATIASPSNSQTLSTTSTSTTQTAPDPMSVDLTGDMFSISGSTAAAVPPIHTSSGLEHWGEVTFNQALEQLDWVFPESDLTLNVSHSPRIKLTVIPFNADISRLPKNQAKTTSRFSTPHPSAWANLQTMIEAQLLIH